MLERLFFYASAKEADMDYLVSRGLEAILSAPWLTTGLDR